MQYSSAKRTKNTGLSYMQVVIGKTVEAFKVNRGIYTSQGLAGAAILGNEENSRYDLYIYREDQQKITSARIAFRFQFEVHANLYTSFYDNGGVAWSLRFDIESDATEFIRELALARWKSGPRTGRILVQQLRHGNPCRILKPDSNIVVRYTVAVLNADNKFSSVKCLDSDEEFTREVERTVSSSLWETPLISSRPNSSRIVIVPAGNPMQNPWIDILDFKNGDHLWLQMDIERISPEPSSTRLDEIESRSSGVVEVRGVPQRDEITSRLLKMGAQGVVPFPTFPSSSAESLNQRNSQGDIDVNLTSKSLDYIKKTSHSSSLPLFVGSHRSSASVADGGYSSTNPHHLPSVQMSDRELASRSELNMLFSEIRTTNSHLCMSMMRMSDKMEDILVKKQHGQGDANSEFSEWLTKHQHLKSDIENMLRIISEDSQAIMDTINQQDHDKTERLERIESMQDDMMNTILSMVNKQNLDTLAVEVNPKVMCSESTCLFSDKTTALSKEARELELLNSRLKSDLSKSKKQVDELEEQLSLTQKELADSITEMERNIDKKDKVIIELRQNINELEKLAKLTDEEGVPSSEEPHAKKLAAVKLAAAERTVEKLKRKITELEDQLFDDERLNPKIKLTMNMAYKALRPLISDAELRSKVASTLRNITQLVIGKNSNTSGSSSPSYVSGRFSPSFCLPIPEDREPVNVCPGIIDQETNGDILQNDETHFKSSQSSSSGETQFSSKSVLEDEQILNKNPSSHPEEFPKSSPLSESVSENILPKIFETKSVLVSPGDGFTEDKATGLICPGDGLPEKKSPVPARRHEPVQPIHESSCEKSSHVAVGELQQLDVEGVIRDPPFENDAQKTSEGDKVWSCEGSSETNKNLGISPLNINNNQNLTSSTPEAKTRHRSLGLNRDSVTEKAQEDAESNLDASFERSSESSVYQSVSSPECNEPLPEVDHIISQGVTALNIRSEEYFQFGVDLPVSNEPTALPDDCNNTIWDHIDVHRDCDENALNERTYTAEDWSDEDADFSNDLTFGPPYAPLVSSEPPPLSSSSSSSSPTPQPVLHSPKQRIFESTTTRSSSSDCSIRESWTRRPPTLNMDEEEDKDAWLFN